MKWLCSELRMIVCSTTLVLLESLRVSTLQMVNRDHWPLCSHITDLYIQLSIILLCKIWESLNLGFLQANCSPARPTESASDKSLVSNFFHKKPRLGHKDTKKIISWYFSDYCAISYRASLSPSDAFEMLTCEKQSSSFKHDRLMNLATTYLLNIIMTYWWEQSIPPSSALTILILS